MTYDVAVVGAGPGGLFAAKTAAQLGLSVVLDRKACRYFNHYPCLL